MFFLSTFYEAIHITYYIESEIMYQVMGEYGYSIEHILMVDIIPDSSVRKAMNEINAGNDMYQLKMFPLLLSYLF